MNFELVAVDVQIVADVPIDVPIAVDVPNAVDVLIDVPMVVHSHVQKFNEEQEELLLDLDVIVDDFVYYMEFATEEKKVDKAYGASSELMERTGVIKVGGTRTGIKQIHNMNTARLTEEEIYFVYHSITFPNYFELEKLIQNKLHKHKMPGEGNEKLKVSLRKLERRPLCCLSEEHYVAYQKNLALHIKKNLVLLIRRAFRCLSEEQ